MKNLVHSLVICLFAGLYSLNAQNGRFNLGDPNENFYVTQKRLNQYFKKHEKELQRERKEQANGRTVPGSMEEQELAGYELFKRWEAFMEPRVYPSGDKTLASRAFEEYQKYLSQNNSSRQNLNTITSATWTAIGPFGDPTGGNAGRINRVQFDPVNPNGAWVCTPDGGLWNSGNNGGSWSTGTDHLTDIGNSDIAFDPTNPQIMYMATGDGDATDSYSFGVLKSTNSGATWSPTGLAFSVSAGVRIYKLLINPMNHNVIFATTTNGLYRSSDAGATWNVVISSASAVTDIAFRPGDTTIVYAVTTNFYKSTDGGQTFNAITSGLPGSFLVDRLALAVTPANPNFVYVVGSSASSSGFYGFYQSTNSGATFTQKATTTNLLGWAQGGNDTGGQGWYTLSMAASPTNPNEVVVGGVNIWRTTNAGTSWGLFAHWTGSGAPYVHADIHHLIYKNGTTLYAGTDGGIFFTANSGSSWAAINGNMNIAEIYKMGLSKTTSNLAITGHQDNGTNIYGGGWHNTMGGDGMDCFIDWSNDQVMYGEQYNGNLQRTTNGGGAWTGITTGLTGSGGWVTPWHQDPVTPNTIYVGYQQMFKSTNQGTNWAQIGTIGGSGTVVEFAIAPSNPQVIYSIVGNKLFGTTNGGTSWNSIGNSLPTGVAQLTDVAVKNTDPNTVYVTFSSYSNNNKVYMSGDGGATWTNYSTGIPNLPANCITYWNGTKGGVFVGCDVGIFYRDSTMTSWVSYSNGLPNVSVRDLEIFYPTGKLRAATFGRGVWEADLYNNGSQPPIASFVADQLFICAGMTVNFSDQSTFGPTSWNWTFQNGTPATSTQQNPSIVYNTPGTYSVSLTATNINGSSTMTQTMYITVSAVNALPLSEGFQGALFPPVNWQNFDASNDGLKWAHNTTVGRSSTSSMFYDNYNLNAAGTRDEMRSPKYNFSALTTVKLYFDVAYCQYDATYSDTLALMVSSDCGLTYNQVYVKGGTTLATAPNFTTSIFIPTAAQWRTDTIYLNAYAGMGNVMVSFQNRGHYGQALYIDNINISGSSSGPAPNSVFNYTSPGCVGQNITLTDQSTYGPTTWSWTMPGATPATSTQQNPVVSYSVTGTYSITLTASNLNGSGTPVTHTIIVNPVPSVTATASTATVCSGQSLLLTGSGATTYTWSPNAGSVTTSTANVSPFVFTTYTVSGSTTGCTNTATVSVNVNPSPAVGVNSSTICVGDSTVLTASGASSFTWSPASNLNTTSGAMVTANPTVTTTYTVTGIGSNNCPGSATAIVTVSGCVGINSFTQNTNFNIYPNPSNGTFNVEIPGNATGSSIEIRNLIGQPVHFVINSSSGPATKTIAMDQNSRGIYLLMIGTNNGKYVRKLIVE